MAMDRELRRSSQASASVERMQQLRAPKWHSRIQFRAGCTTSPSLLLLLLVTPSLSSITPQQYHFPHWLHSLRRIKTTQSRHSLRESFHVDLGRLFILSWTCQRSHARSALGPCAMSRGLTDQATDPISRHTTFSLITHGKRRSHHRVNVLWRARAKKVSGAMCPTGMESIGVSKLQIPSLVARLVRS